MSVDAARASKPRLDDGGPVGNAAPPRVAQGGGSGARVVTSATVGTPPAPGRPVVGGDKTAIAMIERTVVTLRRVTAEAQADALAAAVRAGRADQLPRLLDVSLERVAGSDGLAPEAATEQLLTALRACAAARRFREALAAYEHVASRIGEGCQAIWSVLLYSAVEAHVFKQCEEFYRRLRAAAESPPSGHDVVNMVRYYVHGRDLLGLERTLDDLSLASGRLDAFTRNRALAACTAEGAMDLAEVIARSDVFPDALDAVAYNTLMKGHARCDARRHLTRCFELRAEMQAAGLSPSEVTFGILLDASVGAREVDLARSVFEDLRNSGMALNTVHCTTFIKGLVADDRLEEAAGLLHEMQRCLNARPDIITYSTLVRAYAERGDISEALQVVEQMLQQGVRPDEILFNSVAMGCCARTMEPRQVCRVLDELVSNGLQPSAATFSIILKALARSEAWDVSLELLETAPQRFAGTHGCTARLFVQLAQACLKAGQGRTAFKACEAMVKAAAIRGERVDEANFHRLLRSFQSAGEADAARKLIELASRVGYHLQPAPRRPGRPPLDGRAGCRADRHL